MVLVFLGGKAIITSIGFGCPIYRSIVQERESWTTLSPSGKNYHQPSYWTRLFRFFRRSEPFISRCHAWDLIPCMSMALATCREYSDGLGRLPEWQNYYSRDGMQWYRSGTRLYLTGKGHHEPNISWSHASTEIMISPSRPFTKLVASHRHSGAELSRKAPTSLRRSYVSLNRIASIRTSAYTSGPAQTSKQYIAKEKLTPWTYYPPMTY